MGLCCQQGTILPFIPTCDINVEKRDVCPWDYPCYGKGWPCGQLVLQLSPGV